jgi:hypothetical protein
MEIAHHLLAINVVFQAKKDSCFGLCIEQVIALVLRVVHAELVLNVFGEGVYLER